MSVMYVTSFKILSDAERGKRQRHVLQIPTCEKVRVRNHLNHCVKICKRLKEQGLFPEGISHNVS